MLCDTCLGVLQDCQNLIKSRRYWCSLTDSDASSSVYSIPDTDTESDSEDDTQDNTEDDTSRDDTDDNEVDDVDGADDGTESYTGSWETTEEEEAVQRDNFIRKKTSLDVEHTSDSEYAISHIPDTEKNISSVDITTSTNSATDNEKGADCQLSNYSPSSSSKHSGSDEDANERKRHAVYGHHASFSDLQASARTGCQVCWQVEDFLSRSRDVVAASSIGSQSTADPSLTQFSTFAAVNGDSASLFLSIYFHGSEGVQKACTFGLYPENSEWDTIPISQVTSDSTASCASLQIARKWLQDCVKGHASCTTEMGASQWYPTRLLDLGDLAQEGLSDVRLISTGAHKLEGYYTTLSHRWAKGAFLQLKRHNLDEFHRTIPITELPQTFREAMTFSKTLQVRYMWIDSLCIMQDDDSDWAFEASQMHMVYSSSYCNISASHAEDSLQGLFQDRDPRVLCGTEVDLCMSDQYTAHDVRQKFVLINDELFYMGLVQCPLNKRGWVFQERFLSPRVIHFCRDQLFWECRNHVACEQYQEGLGRRFYANFFGASVKANDAFLEKDKASWFRMWNQLRRTYSDTSLTYPSDKLVAISGIAKMVRSVLHDEYVAGMWRKDLGYQLLWELDGPGKRSSVYRAPSWSWASVDGCIYGHSDEHNVGSLEFEVLDVHIDYVTSDDTGQIQGGWLDLKGALRPIRLEQSIRSRRYGQWAILFGHDPDDEDVHANTDLDDTSLDVDVVLRQSAAGLYFCMVTTLPSGDWYGDDTGYCLIILLRLVEPDRYERIGLASFHQEESYENLMQIVDEKAKSSLPCLQYEDGKHTIRVI